MDPDPTRQGFTDSLSASGCQPNLAIKATRDASLESRATLYACSRWNVPTFWLSETIDPSANFASP